MARSRMLKPEFWEDEKLASVSRDARLTFIGLWNFSDDRGVVRGSALWLKNRIYPYDESLTKNEVDEWLKELESLHVITPFKNHCEVYFYIKNFLKHQKINNPSAWRNPDPPDKFTSFT